MTAPFSLVCCSQTSPNHQIPSPHHRSAPPAPSSTLLPPTCLTSYRGSDRFPTTIPSWSPVTPHLALKCHFSQTPELCNTAEIQKASSPAPEKSSLWRRDVVIHIAFHYSLRWSFIWTPARIDGPHTLGGRKMSFLACIIDAVSWQHICLMLEHVGNPEPQDWKVDWMISLSWRYLHNKGTRNGIFIEVLSLKGHHGCMLERFLAVLTVARKRI